MRIAIIGSGISGMGISYILNENGHDITVFEKNDYIGGHSRTVDINVDGQNIPVDTGFIVFNHRNYPYLTGLFEKLGVKTEKSDMSFGVSIANGWLEYGTKRLNDIFGQKRNFFRKDFWKMLSDISKFNKNALAYIKQNPSATLGQCLDDLKLGTWFRNYYLLAMGGAIWSTPVNGMLDFPAKTFINFFDNHGLLTVNDHPQWYTVSGGSKEYVKIITKKFFDKIRLNSAVISVRRSNNKVYIEVGNKTEEFDNVVFACHSDQTLKLLKDATEEEKNILGNFKYQPNKAILHSDISFMPSNIKCWASWIYNNDSKDDARPNVSLSYWMNNLQNLKTKTPIIVTLNPDRQPKNIYSSYVFEHPVFDNNAINSQGKIDAIQGKNMTWFCGAYQRYGFHEDGLQSAVNVANLMEQKLPWEPKHHTQT
jgi:predicted NAD/FAD-binding protein